MGALQLLLLVDDEGGTHVDAADSEGQTPLHFVARYNQVAAMELLLAHASGLNVRDNDGQTPLQASISAGYVDVSAIKLLLAQGAEVDKDECASLLLALKNVNYAAIKLLQAEAP